MHHHICSACALLFYMRLIIYRNFIDIVYVSQEPATTPTHLAASMVQQTEPKPDVQKKRVAIRSRRNVNSTTPKSNPELPKTLKGDASEQHKNPRPEPDQTEHIPLQPLFANPETHQQLPAKSISSSTSQTLLALQHQ